MKISTLEGLLASFREANGDLDVRIVNTWETPEGPQQDYSDPIQEVKITSYKPHDEFDPLCLLEIKETDMNWND